MNGSRDKKNIKNSTKNRPIDTNTGPSCKRPMPENANKVDLLDIQSNPEQKQPKFGIDITPQRTKRTTPHPATMKNMSEEMAELRSYKYTLNRIKLITAILVAVVFLLFILVCVSLAWAKSSLSLTSESAEKIMTFVDAGADPKSAGNGQKSSATVEVEKSTPPPDRSSSGEIVKEKQAQKVIAHLLFNASKLHFDQGIVQTKSLRPGMSSCERGYDLRQWISGKTSSILMGVGFNETSGRIRIRETAYYSVYSQVMFRKTYSTRADLADTGTFAHLICWAAPEVSREHQDLFVAVTPNQMECVSGGCRETIDTNYISGVVHFMAGDEVYVRVSNLTQVHRPGNPREMFFGLFKVSM